MWSNGDENPLPVVQLVNSIYVHGVLEIAHVNCEVRLCLQEQEEADDQVVAAIDLSKEHGAEARTKKRKNSPLTYEQEEKIRQQPSRTQRYDMI